MAKVCVVPECDGKIHAKGFCAKHYHRVRVYGRPELPTPDERFWAKVIIGGSDDCWLWTGSTNGWGYGELRAGRHYIAHHYAYITKVGPIPAGLDLGHTCHDADPGCVGGNDDPHRRCVNPRHLKPMTRSENMRRGKRSGRTNRCKWGHEWTPENTYITKAGTRLCRTCNNRRQKETQARKRARATA